MTTDRLTLEPETRTIQVWPSGRSVTYELGDLHKTPDAEVEVIARRLQDDEIYCLDSMLVSGLLSAGEFLSKAGDYNPAFSWDDCRNLYPDPSEWDADQCIAWLEDHNAPEVFTEDDWDDERKLAHIRDWVRDHAEPAEVYEWYRVSSYLCQHLDAIGEVTIDNEYGCWWGRCATGQDLIMDGTLQQVAKRILAA